MTLVRHLRVMVTRRRCHRATALHGKRREQHRNGDQDRKELRECSQRAICADMERFQCGGQRRAGSVIGYRFQIVRIGQSGRSSPWQSPPDVPARVAWRGSRAPCAAIPWPRAVSERLHIGACPAAVLPQRQQLADLLDRKAEVAGAADEAQCVDVLVVIITVAGIPPCRLGDQTNALIWRIIRWLTPDAAEASPIFIGLQPVAGASYRSPRPN